MFPQFQERLTDLARVAEPEDWNYLNAPSEHDLPILYNYLHYTFERLEYESKVSIALDDEYACSRFVPSRGGGEFSSSRYWSN